MTEAELDQLCINTIRTLSIDAVQAADSGHPGTPMALAPVVYELWQRVLRFDPADPIWPNRDRFVLSAGHASMLLYSILHLTQTKTVNPKYERLGTPTVSLDDIKKFRQLDSKCPATPSTAGPRESRPRPPARPGLRDQRRHGDRAALAGRAVQPTGLHALRLRRLRARRRWLHDGGRRVGSGVAGRPPRPVRAVLDLRQQPDHDRGRDQARVLRGRRDPVHRLRLERHAGRRCNDLAMLARAFATFQATTDRPTLIIVDSHIGYGSRKQDTHGVHGSPLGVEEVKYVKRHYGWPEDAKFLVPDGVYDHFAQGLGARSHALRAAWDAQLVAYAQQYPELAEHQRRMQRRELPDGWDRELPVFAADPKGLAGRQASAQVLNALAKHVPWLVGGSADLAPSTLTRLTFDGAGDFERATPDGRNFHFGIREHAMAAALNGMALSKLRVYGSGFFVFSDYARPSIRLSALMELAGDPRVHPRLDRRRRRWPDPPADRAARVAARDLPASSCCGPATPTRSSRRGS